MIRVYLKQGNTLLVIVTEPVGKFYNNGKVVKTKAGTFPADQVEKIEVINEKTL